LTLIYELLIIVFHKTSEQEMKTVKKIVAIILIFSLFNCATINSLNTSYSSYKSEDFNKEKLLNSKLAVLPILTDDAKYEGLKRNAGNTLIIELKKNSYNLVAPIDVINKINDADLSDSYADMMKTYRETGILNKNSMKLIASTVDSRYLLYSRLNAAYTAQTKSYDDFGNYTSEVLEVQLYCQIWDSEKGDIVWEGYGGSAKLLSSDNKIDYVLDESIRNLALEIGSEPKDRKETALNIHNQAQSNKAGAVVITSIIIIGVTFFILYQTRQDTQYE